LGDGGGAKVALQPAAASTVAGLHSLDNSMGASSSLRVRAFPISVCLASCNPGNVALQGNMEIEREGGTPTQLSVVLSALP
jgi:hypothetical protein